MDANTLLADPNAIEIEKFVSQNDEILIVVRTIQPTANCPQCHAPSGALKSHYLRRLADLPWHGITVRLELHTRKFRCRNNLCPQKVFCERLPEVVAPHSRRTKRLAEMIESLAFALGARSAAKTTTKLQFPVGKDVCLRAMRRKSAQTLPVPAVRVLGVDDFAFRRGHTYDTILVDLERRQPIDLLPDRTAQTLKKWLLAHPEVEILSRDRSQTYAEAAAAGSPAAEQVADRFHLVKNIGDAFERILHRSRQSLTSAAQTICRREQPLIAAAPITGNRNYQEKCEQPSTDLTGKRAKRVERYKSVKRLRAEGCSINEISRQLRMHRKTVRHFLAADTFPERAPVFRRKSPLARFDAYLQQRWNEGSAQRAATLS
jgi:transposase